MKREIFDLKGMPSTKGKLPYIILLFSIFIISPTPTLLVDVLLIKAKIHNYQYYYWTFAILWGSLYGFLEPSRRYYDWRLEKFQLILKKIESNHKIVVPWRSQLYGGLYIPPIISELLTYSKIKPSDFIAIDTGFLYTKKPEKEFTGRLVDIIKTSGIIPEKVLKSISYPRESFAVYFKDQEDYHLAKICANQEDEIIFFQGKELLDDIHQL